MVSLLQRVHNSNPRYGLILKQRLNLIFNTVSSAAIANFYVRDCDKSYIALDPPFYTSSFLISKHRFFFGIKIEILFLLVTEEHRRIVQFWLIWNLLREHSLDNFWSSCKFSNRCSSSCNRFPLSLFTGLHFFERRSCKNFLFIQLTWCTGFPPELSDQLVILQSYPLLLREDWADWRRWLCGEATQCFSYCKK